MADPQELLSVWTDVLRRVSVCGREMRRAFAAAAAREGLSESEFLILWRCQCDTGTGTAQCDLAAELALSPAQVSGLVERLRTRSLLSQATTRDRRRQPWRITSSGSDLVRRVGEHMERWTRLWETRVPMETRAGLVDVLGVLCELARDPADEGSLDREAA